MRATSQCVPALRFTDSENERHAMAKKFYIQEWRTLDWLVEVPDAITKEDIENSGLEAEDFVEDWTDHGNTEHAYVTAHEVPPEEFGDNEADVVLNHLLEVVEEYDDIDEHEDEEEIATEEQMGGVD